MRVPLMIGCGLLLFGHVSLVDGFDYQDQFWQMQHQSLRQQQLQSQDRMADTLEQSRLDQEARWRRQMLLERERQLRGEAERRQLDRPREEIPAGMRR